MKGPSFVVTFIFSCLSVGALLLVSGGAMPDTASGSEMDAQIRYFFVPLFIVLSALALVVIVRLCLSVRHNGWFALTHPLLLVSVGLVLFTALVVFLNLPNLV